MYWVPLGMGLKNGIFSEIYQSTVGLQCYVNFRCTTKLIHLHVHTHTYIYILFHILFYYGLLQDIEYGSLCYTIGPYCLSKELDF